MDKFEIEERERFNNWFKFLLDKCGDCFQRDVLRANKEAMWGTWITESRKDEVALNGE